ncbi:hypothetical protein RND71_006114 [Anisodus tanguticus]|nr:hypothetical protein RND71_006114 [Anisodus tanguticus]
MKNNIPSCPRCGFASSSKEATVVSTEEQQLRIENSRLRTEVEKLEATLGKYYPQGTSSSTSSSGGNYDQENRNALGIYTGTFGHEKSRIMDIANRAKDELTKMATCGKPLWIKNLETGREILNYDEYLKFPIEKSGGRKKRSIEASRETGIVFMELPRLFKSMERNLPIHSIKAATLDVISDGEGDNWDGAVQLMFAELQLLTSVVGTREVYFVRYCKQLSADQWEIVDVSVDNVDDNIDASLVKCRKLPSGCILQDQSNAHSAKLLVRGIGLILYAASSVWLPVSRHVLFDFLRDETRRHENIISNGGPVQSIANLMKGQDRGNAVTIQAMKVKEDTWILRDTCTNAYESTVFYASVDIPHMKSIMTGCDSSNTAVLPSAKLSIESVESVNNLISRALHRIKTSLQCEDG